MKNVSRRGFLFAAGAATAMGAGCSGGNGRQVSEKACAGFALDGFGQLRVTVPGLTDEVRLRVIGDTHFGFSDARDATYADNYARMGRVPTAKEPFERMLAKAKEENTDILLLVGDTISFPTFANVEYLRSRLETSGLDWYYVAGNHDWHFEGLPGSDEAQRAEWTVKRLSPLYRGRDPLMSSRVVKGVRFIAIDNSIYHVSPTQLDFFRAEAAKGDPVVLFMHIPLWLPEWGLFTCGCPTWGAATDPYWQIERRERWAERQSPSTFAFREAVLSASNLIGVFTGHIHQLMVAQERGKLLLSVPSNLDGSSISVRLAGV